MGGARFLVVLLASLALAVVHADGGPASAASARTLRVSVGAGDVQANAANHNPAISADGRFVAFESDASNLFANDSNQNPDVFVRDRQTGATTLVSTTPSGRAADFGGFAPSMSRDGRFVAFISRSSALVPGVQLLHPNVFVRDVATATTSLASVSSTGAQPNFTLDFSHGVTMAISGNGNFVVFASNATNLVPGLTPCCIRIFMRDLVQGRTSLLSVNSAGESADNSSWDPAISSDGRFVAFVSSAGNLGTSGLPSHRPPGFSNPDVYVHDNQTGETSLVSVGFAGDLSTAPESEFFDVKPAITPDGRYVAWSSIASNLVPGDNNDIFDTFVRDRLLGTTSRVSVSSSGVPGNNNSFSGVGISDDGRFVAFDSFASNLVPGDTNGRRDVFVHDTLTGTTTRVSVTDAGGQSSAVSFNGPTSTFGSMTPDGQIVAFVSGADNLVPGDTNSVDDVFIRIGPPPTPLSVVINGGNVTLRQSDTLGGSGSFVHSNLGASSWSGSIDFGDGSASPLSLDPVRQTFSFAHQYIHPGTFTLTVTITDDLLNSGSASITVTVQRPSPPFVTTSYYVHTNDLGPLGKAQAEAMNAAGATEGIAVLFFGKADRSADLTTFGAVAYPPLGFQTTDQIAAETEAYIESFYNASNDVFLQVAIGTSNCELVPAPYIDPDDGLEKVNPRCAGRSATGLEHGRAWAALVDRINAWIAEKGFRNKVFAVGAIDAETAWGPASKSIAWANGYSDNGTLYYDFGDAGGCLDIAQTDATDRACTTTEPFVWHYSDLAAISWRTPAAFPMPQNYRPDGLQARQWAHVSLWHHYQFGYAFPFTSFMTQLRACAGPRGNTCGTGRGQTGASPTQGWDAFVEALSASDITAPLVFFLRQPTDIANSPEQLLP